MIISMISATYVLTIKAITKKDFLLWMVTLGFVELIIEVIIIVEIL